MGVRLVLGVNAMGLGCGVMGVGGGSYVAGGMGDWGMKREGEERTNERPRHDNYARRH